MKTLPLLIAVLAASACNKKTPEAQPGSAAPKVTEPQPKEPVKPAPATLADMTVTSKSKDALAAFEKGRDMTDLARGPEALEPLKKAAELDPDFALAHAYLGMMTPGPEGTDHLTKAGALAGKLPDAEREWISGVQAMRGGDVPKARASFEKVLQLAPGAWRADMVLGNLANANGASDGVEAIKRFEHALSIKPDLAVAQNGLAYAYASQRNWDKAIAAAKKQVQLLPKEPNPSDTLAEILLWSGKFDESEKAFQSAIALDPKFVASWAGVGLTRAYRGDYKGAYEAYEHQKTAPEAEIRLEAYTSMAWVAAAEDKVPQALAYLDTIEKDPEAKNLPISAFGPMTRGHLLVQTGSYADATKAYATAMTRSESLPGFVKTEIVRGRSLGLLEIAALTGKPAADADKLLSVIDDAVKASPDDVSLRDLGLWAHGLATWGKTGAKDAVPELAKCSRNAVACRFDLMRAQRKAGDTAGAAATAKEIIDTPRRDEVVVYIRTRAAKP